jgi:hypothetical protein
MEHDVNKPVHREGQTSDAVIPTAHGTSFRGLSVVKLRIVDKLLFIRRNVMKALSVVQNFSVNKYSDVFCDVTVQNSSALFRGVQAVSVYFLFHQILSRTELVCLPQNCIYTNIIARFIAVDENGIFCLLLVFHMLYVCPFLARTFTKQGKSYI